MEMIEVGLKDVEGLGLTLTDNLKRKWYREIIM